MNKLNIIAKDDKGAKKRRILSILKVFRSKYPDPKCHLDYDNPFQLLIGCILSAQCTDKRVNEITRFLFKKYKNPEQFSRARQKNLEKEIHSAGFFRNKAKYIINCSKELLVRFNGVVPANLEDLTLLSGVGRKTANVVLGNAYGVPGIIVDTHIKRLSRRIGLTESNDPTRIEFDLMEIVPKKYWTYFSNALGDHGREVCSSRKPKCNICEIHHLCPSAKTFGDDINIDG
jgi:endonuclease III